MNINIILACVTVIAIVFTAYTIRRSVNKSKMLKQLAPLMAGSTAELEELQVLVKSKITAHYLFEVCNTLNSRLTDMNTGDGMNLVDNARVIMGEILESYLVIMDELIPAPYIMKLKNMYQDESGYIAFKVHTIETIRTQFCEYIVLVLEASMTFSAYRSVHASNVKLYLRRIASYLDAPYKGYETATGTFMQEFWQYVAKVQKMN